MPNFYTHLRFGRHVAQSLPPELKNRVEREWDSFCCGNFGPDPLYFCQLRQTGLNLHHGTGAQALERYREAIATDQPYGVSFAAGYFLHHLLDSSLHPLVYRAMEETGCSHRQVEGELDRLLLERDEAWHREAMPVKSLPRAFYYMAGKMAPEVTPEHYAKGLKRFRFVSIKLCDWTGKPVRHAANLASRLPRIHGLYGAVLEKEPEERLRIYLTEMVQCYRETVEKAPERLEAFLDCARQGKPFPEGMQVDFSGNQVD